LLIAGFIPINLRGASGLGNFMLVRIGTSNLYDFIYSQLVANSLLAYHLCIVSEFGIRGPRYRGGTNKPVYGSV